MLQVDVGNPATACMTRHAHLGKQEFFFEKKNQKTFANLGVA
jgi:hypothetical protein